ncbi:MAG TPA: hypothetical protein VNN72_26325 [Polyangiaceae bacterium]|nr:hypothetical protein [Polyangiaceae bacterium]
MTTAGGHAGGATGGGTGGSAGRGTSGAHSAGGSAGSRAGTGQGAEPDSDSAGQAGADSDSGAGGSAGRAAGGAGMSAGSGGHSGTAQGGTGPFGALTPGVDAYCAAAVSCCTTDPSSLAACEASYAEHAMNLPSLMAGFVAVDPEALARCQAAYGGASQCNQNVVWSACRDVLVGTRALGETCRQGIDCERSDGEVTCLILDGSDPDALGVCTPAPRAKLGELCVSTCYYGEKCPSTTYGVGDTYSLCFEDDGLYCSHAGLDAVCQPLVPLGGECPGTEQECGSKAYCETTCQPLSELGEPCGRACLSELQCDNDGKCADPMWATDEWGCKGYAPGP